MSISQAIAPHLPQLRRFARALTGSQKGGDAYVVETLEALVADPDNLDLQMYVAEIDDRRARREPTVPTKLERELLTNPFLRADREDLRNRWGGHAPHETFAKLRAAKDNF